MKKTIFLSIICLPILLGACSFLLGSFLQPFAILFSLPLAMIGVWVALFLADMTFSIFSLMAIIMMVGIVVNNAILILDYAVLLQNQGMNRNSALAEACRVRLRPICMTTLTTVFGMLPLALAIGWGAEMRAPMAVVFIGDLLVSALLTLLVIPVVYIYLDDMKNCSLPFRIRAYAKVEATE